jgi:hypothetical protein
VALHTALHPTSPARHIPRHGIPPLNAMAGRCVRLPTAGCAARDFEHHKQVRFATLRTAEPYCGSCGRVPPQMWAQSLRRCGRSPGADVGARSRRRCGRGPGADVGPLASRCGEQPRRFVCLKRHRMRCWLQRVLSSTRAWVRYPWLPYRITSVSTVRVPSRQHCCGYRECTQRTFDGLNVPASLDRSAERGRARLHRSQSPTCTAASPLLGHSHLAVQITIADPYNRELGCTPPNSCPFAISHMQVGAHAPTQTLFAHTSVHTSACTRRRTRAHTGTHTDVRLIPSAAWHVVVCTCPVTVRPGCAVTCAAPQRRCGTFGFTRPSCERARPGPLSAVLCTAADPL